MLSIYIAEDSAVIRAKLKETLEQNGNIQIIGECGNAEQAINEIRSLNPKVVIIDIRMPGGGGMPILQDIKTRTPNTIAIILTSFPYPQYREAYLLAGAEYFFDKTQDIPKLTEIVFDLALKEGL